MQRTLVGSILLFVAMSSAAANAQDLNPLLNDTHIFNVGIFDQDMDATLLAQRGDFEPIEVELGTLTLDDRDTSGMFEYRYRFADRWSFSASLYRWNNSGGGVVRDSFNFDGQEYEVGVGLATELSVDTYIIDALYSVYRTESTEFSLGGGIHVFDTEVSILAVAEVDGTLLGGETASKADVFAPLPNIRGSFIHAFSDRFAINAVGGWLSANVDDYEGSFTYLHLSGQYQLADSIGLSLGYKFVDVDVEESLSNGRNGFDLQFDGLIAGISYSF